MAMIDYGASVKINGELIDICELFTEPPEWVPEKVHDKNGKTIRIRENYYVYLGDYEFYLCFYKTYIVVCSRDKCIDIICLKVSEETRYYDGSNVTVARIDKNIYDYPFDNHHVPWSEFVREYYSGATGDEKLCELKDGYRMYRLFMRHKKRVGQLKNIAYRWYNSNKFLATWDYRGNHYEVAFGYGVDCVKDIYITALNTVRIITLM